MGAGRAEVRVAWADKEAEKSGYWFDVFEHETRRFKGGEKEALEWAREKIGKRISTIILAEK